MENIIVSNLIVILSLYAVSVNADLYKGVDDKGNVVYSDRPFDNSEKFRPPSLTVVNATKEREAKEEIKEIEPAEFKYTDFDIVSPTNNQTIWNEPEVAVSLQLKPALNIEEDHSIWLYMDGKPVIENSQDLSLQLGRLDRGAHQLQGQVRNQDGKIVARTRAIMIHIKHSVAR